MAKRSTTGVRLTRLEARSRVVNVVLHGAFWLFCLALGFVVVATAFPQLRELERLEVKLATAKEREAEVLADREYHRVEFVALREDPAFLEIHARDRLDYFREGERVLRFRAER
jgi:cell division protein FtsB